MRRDGASIRAIAKQLGVGVGTVTRTLAARRDRPASMLLLGGGKCGKDAVDLRE